MTLKVQGQYWIVIGPSKMLTKPSYRYYQIQCHNSHDIKDQFGNGCTKGSAGEPHAHTIPKATLKGKNINTYDIIVLCDAWFNDFDSFRGKVKKMETDLVYPRDNLLSLKTQGKFALSHSIFEV